MAIIGSEPVVTGGDMCAYCANCWKLKPNVAVRPNRKLLCAECYTNQPVASDTQQDTASSPSHVHAHPHTQPSANGTSPATGRSSLSSNVLVLDSRATDTTEGVEEPGQEALGDWLLTEYRVGRLTPLPVVMRPLPADAPPIDHAVAQHIQLMRGLRLAVGDYDPMLVTQRWGARTLDPPQHPRAVGHSLKRLVGWGIIEVAATYHFPGKRVPANCYLPVPLDAAPESEGVKVPVTVETGCRVGGVQPQVEVHAEHVMGDALVPPERNAVTGDDAAAAGYGADEGGRSDGHRRTITPEQSSNLHGGAQ